MSGYDDLLSSLRTLQGPSPRGISLADLLSNTKTNLAPIQTPTFKSQVTKSVKAVVKQKIGGATYLFLNTDQQFSRCIDLLATSQLLIDGMKGKFFISSDVRKEYAYIVAPAAKALEGILLAIALKKGMIIQKELDRAIKIGEISPGKAKKFVLKEKEKSTVDYIFNSYGIYRNKVLHYDEDHFVNKIADAEDLINNICKIIRLAYQTFIGNPEITVPLATRILP